MIETSARLLALLSLLQLRREWTGPELAQRLEVGPRTIRRDVDKLRSLGYPIQAARGVAGGYRLGAGGRLPPLLLDDAEAVAVAVGLRSAAAASIAGVEETAVQALVKLEQVLPERLRRRVNALASATSALDLDVASVDPEVLTTLAAGCRDGQRVHFGYVARDGRASTRVSDPVGLVHSGFNWYLLAFDIERDDWRTFRVDRISGQVRLGEKAAKREIPGGDAATFISAQRRRGFGPGEGTEPARVRFHVPAAQLRGRVPSGYASIEAESEISCLVTSRGASSLRFLVWCALLEVPMQVLGPPELVESAQSLVARLSAATAGAEAEPAEAEPAESRAVAG